MADDETAHAELRRIIDLTTLADSFVLGWQKYVILELEQMRAEMPYADVLEVRLVTRRES